MTLRTASDLAWALGKTFHIEVMPLSIHTVVEDDVWYIRDTGAAKRVNILNSSSGVYYTNQPTTTQYKQKDDKSRSLAFAS